MSDDGVPSVNSKLDTVGALLKICLTRLMSSNVS